MTLKFQNLVKKVARLHGFKAECPFHRCFMKRNGRAQVVVTIEDGMITVDAPFLDKKLVDSMLYWFSKHYPTSMRCAGFKVIHAKEALSCVS